MAKEANNDGGLDRIGNLPDSVLSCILSLLPFKDAVSTSVLSTRWRHLYASVFIIDVDFRIIPCRRGTANYFGNSMDKILSSQTEERIEQFRLIHVDKSRIDPSRICRWISAAVEHGVQRLDLGFDHKSKKIRIMSIPSILFVSKTLVRLKLKDRCLLTVPKDVDLPCLKTLDLQLIKFEDDGSVEKLVSSCPTLKDLSIFKCDMRNIMHLMVSNPSLERLSLDFNVEFRDKFAVAANLPSLVYFKCHGNCKSQNYVMVHMPSLVTADIQYFMDEDQFSLGKLFEGIGNVKSLDLAITPQALQILSHKRYPALANLVGLIIIEDWDDGWKGEGLFELLELSPNLQSLELPNAVSLPMGRAPPCLLYNKLKKFGVSDFDDESRLFEMVTYILKTATVLEDLTVHIFGYMYDIRSKVLKVEKKNRITQQLMSIPRSSNNCRVVVID